MKLTSTKFLKENSGYLLKQIFLICLFLCLLAGMLYVLINSPA